MATIRTKKNKENPYVMINKTAFEDSSLSYKAKGIFGYLMSKPDDWTCQVTDLIKHAKDGRDSVYAGLKELREYGYLIKRAVKNEKNIITEWEEILYEVPQDEAKQLYQEQKIMYEEAALKRAETIKKKRSQKEKEATENPLTENPQMDSDEKSTYGKSSNGEAENGNAPDIINTESTNIDVTNNTSSSSISNDLIYYFNVNICELLKTPKEKFKLIIENLDKDFIIALIDYCSNAGAKSFSYFETVLLEYLKKKITTVEALEEDITNYRNMRNKAKKNKDKQLENRSKGTPNSKGSFNNYEQRTYDFESLERKLLGWDTVDDEQ